MDKITNKLEDILRSIAKEKYFEGNKHWSKIYFTFRKNRSGEIKAFLNEKGDNFLKSLQGRIRNNSFKFNRSKLNAIHKVPPGKRKLPPINYLIDNLIFKKNKELSKYFRVLAVPRKEDYLVQKSMYDMLNNELSSIFLPVSFAYRRMKYKRSSRRSTTLAVLQIEKLIKKGYRYATKIDISNYFDTVDHTILLKQLRILFRNEKRKLSFSEEEIKVLYILIKDYLNSVNKTYSLTSEKAKNKRYRKKLKKGIFQGHPLSCFLANVYLHDFDVRMSDYGYNIVRYADDITVMTKTKQEANEVYKTAKDILTKKLNLKVNKQKSVIGREEFEFLGFIFSADGSKSIRESTIEKAKRKIRYKSNINEGGSLGKIVRDINLFIGFEPIRVEGNDVVISKRKLRRGVYSGKGWIDYFAECSNDGELLSQMKELDYFTRDRLRCILKNDMQWKRNYKNIKLGIKKTNQKFNQEGLRSFVEAYNISTGIYKQKREK